MDTFFDGPKKRRDFLKTGRTAVGGLIVTEPHLQIRYTLLLQFTRIISNSQWTYPAGYFSCGHCYR